LQPGLGRVLGERGTNAVDGLIFGVRGETIPHRRAARKFLWSGMTRPGHGRLQPTRAARSITWPILLAKARVSDRVSPGPRERVMLTLGGATCERKAEN